MYIRKTENSLGGGLGISSVLQVIFLVLKLCGLIDWPWIWVLSPLWISLGLVAIVFIVVLMVTAIQRR